MPPSSGRAGRRDPAEAHAAIERFLEASRQPVLLEPGEENFPLVPGRFAVGWQAGRLSFEAWDEARFLARRVTGIRAEKPGKLELLIEKFPRREGRLFLMDLARPALAGAAVREKRLSFRERFRRLLSRQFPDWKIAELTSELNLEHSLSAVYPRALLTRGRAGMAAVCAPPDGVDTNGILSFGLIWLDYLRRREKGLPVEGLALFLPAGQERTTCLRLRWIDPRAGRFLAFVYSPEGYTEPADPRDHGNLDTRLELFRDPAEALGNRVRNWTGQIAGLPHVERIWRSGGALSLRVRGLEFVRGAGDELHFGLPPKTLAGESSLREIEGIATELVRLRSAGAPDRENPLYRLHPEGWLESQVRAHLEEVDAALVPSPVYGQVPAFAGGERGLLDLLAVDRTGRLVVLELKASEDVHLPLQALDYWMRVQWHQERGEFSRQGYFPGVRLLNQPPRLLLVAPSLDFHPTTEIILRHMSPEVPVERIGLGVEWRSKLKVAFRIPGSREPF